MISVIIQDRLRGGINTKRKRRRVNPESIRLNPKIKSNLAPTKRINGNWVRKIDMPLKIFNFSSYGYNLIVRKCALNGLLYRITSRLSCVPDTPKPCTAFTGSHEIFHGLPRHLVPA
jgi:hypothetical protein